MAQNRDRAYEVENGLVIDEAGGLFSGTAVPTHSANNGDIYIRSGTSEVYHRESGAWVLKRLDRTIAASIRTSSGFTYNTRPGFSSPIPFAAIGFQTVSGMANISTQANGTAQGTHTSTTLQDTTKSWTVNQFAGSYVYIFSGTGVGQWRTISSNTSDTLTVSNAWDVTPANGAVYFIGLTANRIVIPESGIYLIKGNAAFGASTATMGVSLLVNGASVVITSAQCTSLGVSFSAQRLVSLNQNDIVQMSLFNGDASPIGVLVGKQYTHLEVSRQ